MEKIFVDFSNFRTVSIHQEWKRTRLLSPKREYTSCRMSQVAEGLKTEGLRKLGNFKEISEMLGTDGKILSRSPKAKFWKLC